MLDASQNFERLMASVHQLVKAEGAKAALREVPRLGARPHAAAFAGAVCWSLLGNLHQAEKELACLEPSQLSSGDTSVCEALATLIRNGLHTQRPQWQARKQANLSLLARTQPQLAERIGRLSLGSRHTWVVDNGVMHLVGLEQEEPVFLQEVVSPEGLDRLKQALCESHTPLLFVGMKYGRLLKEAVRLHPELLLGKLIPYYVLEASDDLFLLNLMFEDFEPLCSRGNLRFFVGARCLEELAALLAEDFTLPVPQVVIHAREEDQTELLNRLGDPRANRAHVVSEGARAHFETLSPQQLLQRFRHHPQDPLRVLIVTSRFTTVLQYSARDMAQGLEELGCRVKVIKERSDLGCANRLAVEEAVAEVRPELVISLDHVRPEMGDMFPPSQPFLCWVQDIMLQQFEPRFVTQLGDLDFTYVAAPEWLARFREAGYREVQTMRIAVNPEVYSVPAAKNSRLECELAFASRVRKPEPFRNVPQLLPFLLQEIEKEGISFGHAEYYEKFLRRAEESLAIRVPDEVRDQLVHHIYLYLPRYIWRTTPLRWAVDEGWKLKLFGEGWESIPELAPYACGTVSPGEELRDLFHGATISLHMNEGLNLHQRVFECVASGGFLLARALPSDTQPGGLGDFFEIGREIITFTDRPDFVQKVRFYLGHEQERQRVIEAGRRRILSEHTYARRMAGVLRDIRERLERLCASEAEEK